MDHILDQDVKGYSQIDVKKDVCHFALIIKVLKQHFFPKNESTYANRTNNY